MESDIKLNDDGTVTIVANAVITEAHDLMLNSPGRRKGDNPWRRALVHDFTDGLTLNWDKDYQGGVTVNGNVQVPEKLIVGHTILIGRKVFYPNEAPVLPGNIPTTAPFTPNPVLVDNLKGEGYSYEMIDVVKVIHELQDQVKHLQNQIDRLKK
ncbi:MAG: hypothetical protein ICV83_09855 [Cytophagales bacterium]|nr:hypothetical protein [Cytophagales bacterium]